MAYLFFAKKNKMKKTFFRLFLKLVFSFMSLFATYGQKTPITGPLAKNRKPWENSTPRTVVYLKKYKEAHLTGPLAKNRKIWDTAFTAVPIKGRRRKRLTGPLAKNARPERGNFWVSEN